MRSKDQSLGSQPLLTLQEAAAVLRASVKTLRRRIDDGKIAVIRDGRIVRIHPDDLDRYVRSRRYG
jgi:excisionase family DNA binding protein